ncbi:MFS transporter [Mesobacillus maritimus]|uniref:MFS transporter n=1 Tax=Mesobacillus maritimus TaxID=1643336 RepID=UPI00203F4514|nr:MFS transporter [Mesobacillus maritimus]MCM3584547.1 MFS transporter [Mesobacillus maritimus]MCM3671616.1 MFS transporter [Mesobacillus maritimus]
MSFQSDKEKEQSWVQDYIDSPQKKEKLYRKSLFIVVLSQIFGGAGLAAGITVGALLAQEMLGTDRFAGIPTALFTLGSAAAAFLVGRLSQKHGRRIGIASGFLVGGIGAVGVVLAAVLESVFLLFASLLIYGAGTATNLLARYAGTDLANSKQRATAVSIAMVFTTFGAVAGPNMVGVMGKVATAIGVPSLAGTFILAAAAYILAGLIILIFLRPDPLIVATELAKAEKNLQNTTANVETNHQPFNRHGVIVGATIMVLTQLVMIAVMTITPVHMGHYGHDMNAVGLVIGTHIGAMFLPSLITGVLVDKLGRTTMAIASGVTLLLSGVLAAWAPGESVILITVALALLGLGWNFGLISGTALIVDATTPANRAKTQGTVDVLIALSGATGGALSGMVVAHSSYATLSLAGGFLSLLLIPVVFWARTNKK